MKRYLVTLTLFLVLIVVGCDHLDDGDNSMMNDILPGKWAFSYVIKGDKDVGMTFNYKQVQFKPDASCSISYIDHYEPVVDEKGNVTLKPVDGYLYGTYQATSDMIRIVSDEFTGEETVMIWRVTSLSARKVVVEYDFMLNGNSFTAIVTLEKV